MERPLLHIYRNTPFGRETLLQSAYTCRRLKRPLDIFLPKDEKFLFYFDNDVVQVDLDRSYLNQSETAQQQAEALLQLGPPLESNFFAADTYTATGLPDLPTDYDVMTCPRSMSDVTTRIGLGHIGPKVRRILQTAPFPVLIPSPVYKPWTSLAVLYGGSELAANALRLALDCRERSNARLQIFSFGNPDQLREQLDRQGLTGRFSEEDWVIDPSGCLADHFNLIPHDALVILGAYGHGPIKALFGSTMEQVQSNLPNNLLVVGPNYRTATLRD